MRVIGKFLATGMALMLLLALGCGGDDDDGQAQSAPPATTAAAASGATQAQESAPESVGTPTGPSANTDTVLEEATLQATAPGGFSSQADQVTALLGIYWAAFNDYDADAALAILEESYKAMRESSIRAEITQLKADAVVLEWTQDSLLRKTGPTSASIFALVEYPTGSRRFTFQFTESARGQGDWLINYAEETE
jgi:hypothetical protein